MLGVWHFATNGDTAMLVVSYNMSFGHTYPTCVSVYGDTQDNALTPEDVVLLTTHPHRPNNNSVWMVPGTFDPNED